METRNEHLIRQFDLIPEDVLGEPITIIGVGAIGSWTTLALAKMGFQNLTVFDDDKVSIENMNSQFYPMNYWRNDYSRANNRGTESGHPFGNGG